MNLPTLKPITNRDSKTGEYSLPADGFYQLSPIGEFPHSEGKVVQVVDREAVQAMVNRFAEDSKQPGFVGLLVDYEHFSYDTSKKSEAAGWLTALENREDGLYGKIDWTPDARAELTSGKYRFISPTWLASDVKYLGNRKVRPVRLDRAGVTNTPRLAGLAPLSNRSGGQSELHQGEAWEQDNNSMQKLALMAAALGLAATATEEAVLAGVTELKNRATTLETENKTLREAQVETDLEKYSNRYSPDKKDAIKQQLLTNRAATIAILDAIPEPQGKGAPAAPKAPLHNRQNAKAPEKSPAGATGDIYAKQNAEVKAYMNRNNVDFDSAFQAVMAEKPELFPADDASE
ncbi:MAG TPA: phage protease [Methylomirabilota bacterium]|nr:phage protease [Methylomirabilota bacterium]